MFCLTGRVLDHAHSAITHQQAAIDALLAALGSTRRSGGDANGDRAALAARIPREEWDAANELVRSQGDRLLRRARAAGGEETQLALVLRGDYAAFHARWPHVGIYRADDTVDDSQVIAVTAYGLKPRGFAFPEFAAILHILYGKDAIARKGLARRRQDVAALWFKAPSPRFAPRQEAQTPDGTYSVPSTPRGRAGDHAALVERVYTLLRDYRVGVDALVKTSELAASLGIDRRTVNTILAELRQAGRISTRRAGQYAGLVISFSDGIYSSAPAADQPIAAPEIETEAPALEETDAHVHTHRVSLQSAPLDPCSDREPQTLAGAINEALDCYGTAPGRQKPLDRVKRYLTDNYSGRWPDRAIEREYHWQLKARRWSR
jgi:hypothetical protein